MSLMEERREAAVRFGEARRNKGSVQYRLGPISHVLAPGWGCCDRCETAVVFVDLHYVDYFPQPPGGHIGHWPGGLGALCEECWDDLTPTQRLPYYRKRWAFNRALLEATFPGRETWNDDDPPDLWWRLREAVLSS